MLRNDFDTHPLWGHVDDTLKIVDKVGDTATAEELLALQRIDFLLRYVRSFSELAATSSEMFNANLLDPVDQTVTQVAQSLNQRAAGPAYRSYTDNAMYQAESLLPEIGLWPRPYARGVQVKQMGTLFQDLLSAQADQIAVLQAKHADARADIDVLLKRVTERKDEVQAELETFRVEGQGVLTAVNDQKSRIDDVIQKGLERVNDLQNQNSDAFDAWKADRQKDWEFFAGTTESEMKEAVSVSAGYLKTIREEEKQYANISTHLAGAKLGDEYNKEASSAQKLGLGLYAIGFVILAASAAPLMMMMIWPPVYQNAEGPWQHFLVRVSLGVLGASAATVLIRLGSRFVTGATASRRMALELQTFGPFLANVKDKNTVDGARLELVDRAFGKSYAPNDGDSSSTDAVPVTAFAHILEIVKAIK